MANRKNPPIERENENAADDSKLRIRVRLDRDIRDHFRATGPGWQDRINETLRRAVEREKKRAKS
jgi:uncharacterized protein (DUF4415 family)